MAGEPTFNPPVAPSPGQGVDFSADVDEAPFGDGYTQGSAAGLNSIRRRVSLFWSKLGQADRDTIVAFFVARAGFEPFLYTLPGDTAERKWRCKVWRDSSPSRLSGRHRIEATFEEDFSN
nr:hypothetical protein 1 [bacterium]